MPMNLTPEQQKELAQFPTELRALIEAELSSGNSIVEIGHSHPAPPVGAYLMLASKVSTRPRVSGNGLTFYERNNSNHSGEFTDAKRFFFVLEPPNPPPPEPDMDAIRKALEPKPDPLMALAQRPAAAPAASVRRPSVASDQETPARKRAPRKTSAKKAPASNKAATTVETPTGRTHLLHFTDPRPPQEVQFSLERVLMTPFASTLDQDGLRWHASANVNGLNYQFELRFLAALPAENRFSFRTEVSWADQPETHHDYFRKTSASWIEMWTRELTPANPPAENGGSTEPYRALCQSALQAEAHLDSVEALQHAVIAGLKRGGRFATSHKEGGTNIYWRIDRFVRSDHGDDPDHKEFTDETEFLRMLRQFCHRDVTCHAGNIPRSEFDAWKLILRRMHHQ